MYSFKKCFECGEECVTDKDNSLCPKCNSDQFYPIEANVFTFNEIVGGCDEE